MSQYAVPGKQYKIPSFEDLSLLPFTLTDPTANEVRFEHEYRMSFPQFPGVERTVFFIAPGVSSNARVISDTPVAGIIDDDSEASILQIRPVS